LDWQKTKPSDSLEIVNGHSYYGPHKWIICLLGSGDYQLKFFLNEKSKELKKQTDLSISCLALSDTAFNESEAQNLQELTGTTIEGVFANITKKDTRFDELVKQFFAHLDVYPSEPLPILKETFTAS
jgi:hypothetical protein